MPKPKIDYLPNDQYSLQQFLHAACAVHYGALGKNNGQWSFGPDAPDGVKLSSRADIREMLDIAEHLGVIVPGDAQGEFVPYRLAPSYEKKFAKFAS
ncbi:MAG TPA: hypothetical protein PLF13_05035 [candidate division Zixibacteria bacterium]|nr:hypothetical protein [candidate division Zixibacteria bacterium]